MRINVPVLCTYECCIKFGINRTVVWGSRLFWVAYNFLGGHEISLLLK